MTGAFTDRMDHEDRHYEVVGRVIELAGPPGSRPRGRPDTVR